MVQPPHADLPPEPYVGLRPYLSQENGIFFGRFDDFQ